jgi:hypothetical protein
MDGYRQLLASDVSDRDGLGLELYGPDGALKAEVFRDDTDGLVTFITHGATQIPLSVIEEFLVNSRHELT